jgi:ElaB/YqjD/DUF883 family membrane-anchored ribosome-binding protein
MKTREITEKAKEFGNKARELGGKVQDWQKQATETAREVGEKTDAYVRENTWASIAAAALVGCLVGFMIAGSRGSSRRREDDED